MKQYDNALCHECAELFIKNGLAARRVSTIESAKCVNCKKKQLVCGVLENADTSSRR